MTLLRPVAPREPAHGRRAVAELPFPAASVPDCADVIERAQEDLARGHRDRASRRIDRALQSYCDAADWLSVAAVATFITKEIDPARGLQLLLDKCVANGLYVLGNEFFDEALKFSGQHEALQQLAEIACQKGLWLNSQGFRNDDLEQQERNIARGLPPLLLVTMPKSGSVYISKHLARLYRTTFVRSAVDSFPRSLVIPSRAALLARGGLWDQSHLDATAENFRLLATAGLRKIYLHVRDPRQATLSWLHGIDRNMVGANRAYRLTLWKALPQNYDDLPMDAKLDWHVRNTYPVFVRWVLEWARAMDTYADRFEFRFGRFLEFAADPTAAINDVLEFYGIPDRLDRGDDPASDEHFRQGRVDEWKEVFSAAQRAAMSECIPAEVRNRFGWA